MPIKTIYKVIVEVPECVWEHDDYRNKANKILAPWQTWESNSGGWPITEVATFATLSDAKCFENQLTSLIEKIKKNIMSRPVDRY